MQYTEFRATSSIATISKRKEFFWIFYSISEVYMKFEDFETKDEYYSLIISQILESKRSCYLNVWKVLLQNTIR